MIMKLTKNNKLIPITNSNYTMKETSQELIELIKDSIPIVNISLPLEQPCEETYIIGYVDIEQSKPVLKDDDFIHGNIMWLIDDYDKYHWKNAEIKLDDDCNIIYVIAIEYEKEK